MDTRLGVNGMRGFILISLFGSVLLLNTSCMSLIGHTSLNTDNSINREENQIEEDVEGWNDDGVNIITNTTYDTEGYDYFGFDKELINYKTLKKIDELGNDRFYYSSNFKKYKPYKKYYKYRASKTYTGTYDTSDFKVMHTGPRGGTYYYNSKGKKVYKKKK